MTKSHLFVMDPLEEVDPNHDTTYVIMREFESRGGEVWVCQSRDLFLRTDAFHVNAKKVSVKVNGSNHYEVLRKKRLDLNDFQLVWMREDPPFDLHYLHSTYLLEHAPVRVINSPEGIRNSNEKMLSLEVPGHLPPTWVGTDRDEAQTFLKEVGGEAVAKTLEGFGGEQVFRLSLEDPNRNVLLRQLTENGQRPIMLQKFLPEVTEKGDRRVIVVGGEPIGGLTRYPAEGDFRSNIHSGGRAGECEVKQREREICGDLKPLLLERGLHLVGLDLIGDRITEINVTSPTCVQEINQETGETLESRILDYVESLPRC